MAVMESAPRTGSFVGGRFPGAGRDDGGGRRVRVNMVGSLSCARAARFGVGSRELDGMKLCLDLCSGNDDCLGRSRGVVTIVGRTGGGRTGGGSVPYRPRPTAPRRPFQQQQEPNSGGPLVNNEIRVPLVRLLDEDQNMIGVVPTAEALQRSRDAELDLVMISSDADPPVVRIMDFSKYKYELQKKKREQQKKAAASRMEQKELKIRYNIDTHDYAVRLRAAHKFLKDGDKVKVVCQFKGRELEFKELGIKLFERFVEEIGEIGVLETKITVEGKTMMMVIAPNKVAVQKAQSQPKSKLETNGQLETSDKTPASV